MFTLTFIQLFILLQLPCWYAGRKLGSEWVSSCSSVVCDFIINRMSFLCFHHIKYSMNAPGRNGVQAKKKPKEMSHFVNVILTKAMLGMRSVCICSFGIFSFIFFQHSSVVCLNILTEIYDFTVYAYNQKKSKIIIKKSQP